MTFKSFCTAFVPALFLFSSTYGQAKRLLLQSPKLAWVDSVYNQLNQEEKIGQLFMVAAYSGGKNYNEEAITKLINAHQIGGLIFMQGGPVRQAIQTNTYQHSAQVPLLIAMDAEWGLGMRLDSVQDLPRQMMLGATRDTSLVYRVAMTIAYQCRRLGVHIDFAPVVDVNSNPANPIINSRSFGEDKMWVSKLGIAYMKGLQDNGVMACAKHFPGHGDTYVDSHKDLPLVSKSFAQMDTLELYPFRQMIKAGIKSIMVAHLEVPSLETEAHVPTTLSKNTVTGLLKNKLGYTGLIFTDALNMQGVAKYFSPGDADLRAFVAGNDVLLFSQDVPTAITKIKIAIEQGLVTQADLEQRVKKILAAKYDAGLMRFKDVDPYNITNDLNQYTVSLRRLVERSAVTLVRDDNGILNKVNGNMRVAYIGVNASTPTPLYDALNDNLGYVKASWLPQGTKMEDATKLLDKSNDNDVTVIGVHNISLYPAHNYGLDNTQLQFLQQAQSKKNVIIALMGNAYAMQPFCKPNSAIVAYEDDSTSERAVAAVLLKKLKAKGKLPVTPPCITLPVPAATNATASNTTKSMPGGLTNVILPADAGVKDASALDKLNLFIQRCIQDGAFPGCRVVAAKNGMVFYDQSFGYYTYSKDHAVDTGTLYDVASMTKVVATTLAIMRLYETGKIELDKTLGDYLPITAHTDKARLKIRDILLHQAGLKSWVPFYKETLDATGNLNKDLYHQNKGDKYTTLVAKDLYLRNDYKDTIWSRILSSPLENKGKFVYSDLDFYFLAAVVQQITGKTIDVYADEQFYKPMELTHITYNPLSKFKEDKIAPTEYDMSFRHEQVLGYVHDPGAAMLGGVAGHAGVFATAGDVAAIFQMLLNKGMYHGRRYFKEETINHFTAYNTKLSRRGLGFDKPSNDANDGGPSGDRSTGYTFGHQGFTGTCAWADPGTGVVFVFLSNRVYPSADNNKTNRLNVRTVVQDYIYESLGLPVNHDRPQVYKAQVN
jgi:beta-N-acetylhexosaminidase